MFRLLELSEVGQSYWLDNLTRDMIRSGALEMRIREQGLRGVTSNPAIFNKAMTTGDVYLDQFRRLKTEQPDMEKIYEAMAIRDVQDACDLFRPLYEETEGLDGFVSLEVSPHLAHDAEATMQAARRLFAEVGRPNCYIKIPGTRAGLKAIEDMLYEGIPVNITLLFSVERYEQVARCYIRALERRLSAGRTAESPPSVASFFLSRIDVLVDQLLAQRIPRRGEEAGPAARLLGLTAVANARVAYQCFKHVFSGEAWSRLARAGARVQRPLWASTGNKNPQYRDVRYVEPLIGRDTVITMPEETITAAADHAELVADSVERDVERSRGILHDLAELGIDCAFVAQQLENEGIQKFIDPYESLLEKLASLR